ncbi:gluconokinase [Brucellaceae bacterium C25G]
MHKSPRHYVVFGVSGAGKTTIGRHLAEALGYIFADADDFHCEESIKKMSAGIPLTTADREPWLNSIREWMDLRAAEGQGTVIACSALKRAYRDQLRAAKDKVEFIHLDGSKETITARLAQRLEHFMPVSLLASQFGALEPLMPDEGGITVDVRLSPDEIIAQIRKAYMPVA